MSKIKIIGGILLVLIIGVVAIGALSGGNDPQVPDILDENETPTTPDPDDTDSEESEPKPIVDRYEKIPSSQAKMAPEDDHHTPVLHSFLWEDPVILEGGINTAGAEDSPFVSPDGNSFYFFFTPDVSKPVEAQLTDGVTGIWVSRKENGVWGEAELVDLTTSGPSLDGCAYVSEEEIWFLLGEAW